MDAAIFPSLLVGLNWFDSLVVSSQMCTCSLGLNWLVDGDLCLKYWEINQSHTN